VPVEVISRHERVWKPHAKQEQYISLPFSVFEALYGGAVGGGKSELLYMLPIVYGFHEQPGFHGVLFRETFPQLEASLIMRAIPIYKLLGAHYDPQKHVATFPSGAKIRFAYVENIKDAWEHDTNEYQYMGFDELTHFDERVYLYLTSRVRSLIRGIPPIIRSATNPGNVGHLWVRKRFVEPAPEGNVLIYDSDSETKRAFIKALLTDNPHLLEKDPGYAKRLRVLPEADYRAKVLGDWWVFAGQVFTEWRDPFFGVKLLSEPENACHVIEDYEPPLYLPRIVACDWGFSPGKTWVGWAAVTPQKRAILYRERVWSKTNISVWGAEVATLSQRENDSIVARKLDPSAWGHKGEDKTIAEQVNEATGWNWDKADNDRIGGKALMHEFLRWKPRPPMFIPEEGYDEGKAYSILRNLGPQAFKDYCEMFEPEAPETNLPRLLVTKSCTEFRKVIPACIYPEDDGKGRIQKEDVLQFTGDDAYDGGRYLVKAVDDYCNLAEKAHEKFSELAVIVEKLEKSHDWNTYYREMANYEKRFISTPKSIPRRGGGSSRGRRFRVH
jgi:hypothetical protein